MDGRKSPRFRVFDKCFIWISNEWVCISEQSAFTECLNGNFWNDLFSLSSSYFKKKCIISRFSPLFSISRIFESDYYLENINIKLTMTLVRVFVWSQFLSHVTTSHRNEPQSDRLALNKNLQTFSTPCPSVSPPTRTRERCTRTNEETKLNNVDRTLLRRIMQS